MGRVVVDTVVTAGTGGCARGEMVLVVVEARETVKQLFFFLQR